LKGEEIHEFALSDDQLQNLLWFYKWTHGEVQDGEFGLSKECVAELKRYYRWSHRRRKLLGKPTPREVRMGVDSHFGFSSEDEEDAQPSPRKGSAITLTPNELSLANCKQEAEEFPPQVAFEVTPTLDSLDGVADLDYADCFNDSVIEDADSADESSLLSDLVPSRESTQDESCPDGVTAAPWTPQESHHDSFQSDLKTPDAVDVHQAPGSPSSVSSEDMMRGAATCVEDQPITTMALGLQKLHVPYFKGEWNIDGMDSDQEGWTSVGAARQVSVGGESVSTAGPEPQSGKIFREDARVVWDEQVPYSVECLRLEVCQSQSPSPRLSPEASGFEVPIETGAVEAPRSQQSSRRSSLSFCDPVPPIQQAKPPVEGIGGINDGTRCPLTQTLSTADADFAASFPCGLTKVAGKASTPLDVKTIGTSLRWLDPDVRPVVDIDEVFSPTRPHSFAQARNREREWQPLGAKVSDAERGWWQQPMQVLSELTGLAGCTCQTRSGNNEFSAWVEFA
jgi:hypothetical protein